jgi:uncharacterized protein YcaQ
MLPAPLKLTVEAARRFQIRSLLLDTPAADVATALHHHGFIQIDPINICGRMHDLILRNRVAGYREGDLHEHIHSADRPGFEHYLIGQGILVAFPLEAWPYLTGRMALRQRMRHTWSGKLTPREAKLAGHVLAEIAARGPLTSDDIEHDGRARSAWGTEGRLVKRVLEKLFAHGRVLITARKNFRRLYDLPERVLPAAVLAQPPRSEPEVALWAVLAKLRQRRLVTLKRDELKLVADHVQLVTVEGCPPLFCLRTDAAVLEASASMSTGASAPTPRLLAPLDPLIYDRTITDRLWNFKYTWEVYTPAHKRVRGYYALPILVGTQLVGHIDSKAERARGKLVVISRRVRRGHKAAAAVKQLAEFLSLRK